MIFAALPIETIEIAIRQGAAGAAPKPRRGHRTDALAPPLRGM